MDKKRSNSNFVFSILFIISVGKTAFKKTLLAQFFLFIAVLNLPAQLVPRMTILPSTSIEVGQEVFFSAEGTAYTDSDAIRCALYEWDFGDGTYLKNGWPEEISLRSGLSTIHYYMKPGTFTVTLSVKVYAVQKNGDFLVHIEPKQLLAETTTTTIITVTGEAPMAGFSIDRAPFQARIAQFLYVNIPASVAADAGNRLVMTLTSDKGYNSVLADKAGLNATERVLLEQRNLPQGNYRLVTELRNSSGAKISRWVELFTKPYNGAPKYGINEWNAVCINGKPTYLVTSYMTDRPWVDEYQVKGGINCLNTIGWYDPQIPDSFVDYLGYAKNRGFPVIGPGRGNYDPYDQYNFYYNDKPGLFADYVNACKDADNLIMWSFKDEPNMGGRGVECPPSVLAAHSYTAHQYDPTRAVAVNMYGFDYLPYYGTDGTKWDYINSDSDFGGKKSFFCEVMNMDAYPFATTRTYDGRPVHPSFVDPNKGIYAIWIEGLEAFKLRNKNLIPFFQYTESCQMWTQTIPIPAEQVLMEAWICLVHEMKGVNYFDWFERNTIRWDSINTFIKVANNFGEIILSSPEVPQITDDSNVRNNRVDSLTRKFNGKTYLFAVRVTEPEPDRDEEKIYEPATITTTFTVPEISSGTVEVLDENAVVQRTLSLSAGKFSDTFPQFTTRIYRLGSSGANQTIYLGRGWNWISFNVLPVDRSLNSVFAEILSQVDQVKSQTQSASRLNGNWMGDLADMNGIQTGVMYKIYVNQACTLTVTGTQITATTPISLTTGWNWAAFYPSNSLPINQALTSITGQVLQVKSQTESAIYQNGSWQGDLTQMQSGKGYTFQMSGRGNLTYPTAQ